MRAIYDPEIRWYPERFVKFAFPWGKRGTPLAEFTGPRQWQEEELVLLGEHVRRQLRAKEMGEPLKVYKRSVVSGRGIGKSALVSYISTWMISCVPGSTSVVTSNTESQLRSRTFPEILKWMAMSINYDWFDYSGLNISVEKRMAERFRKDMGLDCKYYYVQGQPWSKENPSSFAGLHNMNGFLLVMDEASGIPSSIYDVSSGFFSDPSPVRAWFAFSNGRRNIGPFYDSHHRDRKYWNTRGINALDVKGIDHEALLEIVDRHGEDSDQAIVEVYGGFAKLGEDSYISRGLAQDAVSRKVELDEHAPLVMGVDVARKGTDSTVICFRKGRDATSIAWKEIKKDDTMEIANEVARLINEYNPEAVFVDAIGVGSGVYDRLKELRFKPIEVMGSHSSEKPRVHGNARMDMWEKMKDWLKTGSIPENERLVDDLIAPKQVYMGQSEKMIIESKDSMRQRGLPSPDWADALSMTFYRNVVSSRAREMMRGSVKKSRPPVDWDYDPFN